MSGGITFVSGRAKILGENSKRDGIEREMNEIGIEKFKKEKNLFLLLF